MKSRIRKIITVILEVFGMVLLYAMLDTQGMIKYIVSLMLVLFILVLNYKNVLVVKEDGVLILPILIYCILGIVMSMCGGTKTLWTIKNVLFVLFPPIVSYVLCLRYGNKRRHMVNISFCGSVIAYLYCNRFYFLTKGYCESTFAFVFGLFILYYLWNKHWEKVGIAAVCMHLANKRIAVLAVIACIVLMLVMKLLKYKKKWIYVFWIMLIATAGIYVYSIYSGVFENLCIRLGVDTSHRLEVYPVVVEHIPKNYFWGQGLGTTNEILVKNLETWLVAWFENPHNDFLKMFVDLGSIGFVLVFGSYLFVFYIVQKKSVTDKALSQLFVTFVYFMLLMTTDNVSIYILFLIPMYSICLSLMEEKEESNENHAK